MTQFSMTLTSPHRSRRRNVGPDDAQRGATLLVVALLMVPLLIVTALVIDVGYAKQRRRVVQTGADAAALAAAHELDGKSGQIERALSVAKTWAAKNIDGLLPSAWAGCQDSGALAHRPEATIGNSCISFDSAATPNRVRVRIPIERTPQFLGQLAQNRSLEVDAFAVAGRVGTPPARTGDCGLCARDWIQWAGTQDIQIIGGGTIHTTTMTANWNTSSSTIAPCPVKAVYSANNPPNARCPGTQGHPISFVPDVPPDPFAGLPAPPTDIPPCRVNGQACNVNRNNAASLLLPDRVFTQSVDLSNITLELAPGNYYFGEGFKLNGGVNLSGTGVTLFFVCASSNQASRPCSSGGQRGGSLEAQGSNNYVTITAPTSGPYAGMAVYFDRNNTQGTAPKLAGSNSTYTFHGSIYAYSGKFTGTGNRLVEVYGQIYTQWWEDNGGGRTRVYFEGGGSSTSGSTGGFALLE